MLFFKYLFALLLFFAQVGFAEAVPHSEEIMLYSDELPHYGILKKIDSDGYLYVDLDNEYIFGLIKFIENERYVPPMEFDEEAPIGAHISVIYSNQGTPEIIEECGIPFHFRITGCQIVKLTSWPGVSEVYILVVEAPELDQIREKYGFPKVEHPFHITIGVKPI